MLYTKKIISFLFAIILHAILYGHGFGPNTLVQLSNGSQQTIYTLCLESLRNTIAVATCDIQNSCLSNQCIKVGKKSKTNCYIKLGFGNQFNEDYMSKNVYCCGALDYQIQDKYCPIKYNKKWREYRVRDFSSTSLSLMMFCPNCGTRLPSSLRDEWFDILEQEYGLEDPMDQDKKKIPEEFMTDEWWKKRKLKNKNEDTGFLSLEQPIRCLF